MLMDRDLPSVLHAVLTQRHRAVTAAKMITIGQYVIDARIVDATPEAAAWYGVEDRRMLIGQWQSQLQHPDDVWLGRVFSQARRRGLEMPTRYVSRIRQLRTPGTYTAVLKEVAQMAIEDDVYWFTVLSAPTEAPLALQEKVFQRFPIPPEVFQYLDTCMSVADMEQVLAERTHARGLPAVGAGIEPRPMEVALGETVMLAEESYLHRCARCTGIWMSEHANPPRCGKRHCQQPGWREVAEPFRVMQREGVVVTPAMVVRARGARRKSRV